MVNRDTQANDISKHNSDAALSNDISAGTELTATLFNPEERQAESFYELEVRNIAVEPSEDINASQIGPRFVNDNCFEIVIPVTKDAEKVCIALYDSPEDSLPYAVIPLDKSGDKDNLTNYSKRFSGEGIGPEMHYHVYVDDALLLDPKSHGTEGGFKWLKPEKFDWRLDKESHLQNQDHISLNQLISGDAQSQPYIIPKSVAINNLPKVPEGEHVLIPPGEKVIYEFHPFSTKNNPHVPEADRGMLTGLVSDEIISHLKSIGVTSIKLPPLHFSIDEPFLKSGGKDDINAWGYNTAHFFGLNDKYFPPGATAAEKIAIVRSVTKKLHEEGFEVIADFVVAHSCESTKGVGPAIGMRRLAEPTYYRMKNGEHVNASACGNSINTNNETVQDLICSAARFYREILGFDGLRIDQANTLMRDENLIFNSKHPLMKNLVMIYGPMQIFNETTDMCNIANPTESALTLHYADFPDDVFEITFRSRDIPARLLKGEREMPGETGSVESLIAYLHSGSSDLFRNLRYKKDISASSFHDGKPILDQAIEAEKEQRKNFPEDTYPEMYKFTKAARILANARFLMAFNMLTPGAISMSLGTEVLRYQFHDDNAYNKPELLEMQTKPKHHFQKMQLECAKNIMTQRKEFGEFFHRHEHSNENELSWFNAAGKKVTTPEEWNNLNGFVAQLFNNDGQEMSAGSYYQCFSLKPQQINLPKAPEGMEWVRRFDTQLRTAEQQNEEIAIMPEFNTNREYKFNHALAIATFELRKIEALSIAA